MKQEISISGYFGDDQTPLINDDAKSKRQKQKYRSHSGEMKERENKRNGIIGTSPKSHLELRKRILQDIMLEHPDFTQEQIRDELLKIVRTKSRYTIPPNFKVPSLRTIGRNLNELHRNDIKQRKMKDLYKEDEFQHFSRKYGTFINQVRISVLNQEYLFFPITDQGSITIPAEYYFNKVNIIREEIKKTSVSQYALLHLFIIFSETGFEDFLCRLFKSEFENVLYTSTHNYCAEIVLEFIDFDEEIITSIYNLLPHSILTRPNNSESENTN